jgi:predicted acetyltransferase
VSPTLRRAGPDDLAAIARVDSRGFGFHHDPVDIDDLRPLFEPGRYLLATEDGPDGEEIIGVAGSYSFAVTLPGGTVFPTQGVTWVSVPATHRRRGVLRAMMTAQLTGFAEEGVALSLLTASDAAIYGRYGYGPASQERTVEVDRRYARFRTDAPDPGGVRYAEPDRARAHAPEVHRRWAAATPGAVARDGRWWDAAFHDRERHRGGGSALFHLVHPDGYASYRVHPGDVCKVVDLFAATAGAHAALWRVLLGLDLVSTVRTFACPLDDPLPLLLEDPRLVRTVGLRDGVWARVVDVPATLAARRYAVEVDAVLEVADPLLAAGGRFRLRGGPDGAECAPTTRPAQARTDIAALGSVVFGAHRWRTLAAAGRVDAAGPVPGRLDAAFAPERDPRHGTHF